MDEPVFSEPWHAQLFALTVALSQKGHFSWEDWTQSFGAALARHGAKGPLDGGNDYYLAWLDSFEAILGRIDLADDHEISALTSAWRTAYLSTPHGHPVKLAD